MPRICVPVFGLEGMRAAAQGGADIIELRLDRFPREELRQLLSEGIRSSIPLIATCRPVWEMGAFTEGEGERLEILQEAAKFADFVDVELQSGSEFIDEVKSACRKGKAKLIISEHFSRMPQMAELERTVEREKAAGADVCKIVPTAEKPADNEKIFELIAKAKRKTKIVSMAMGGKGMLSRLLSPFFGSEFTFAAQRTGLESAPGQLSLEGMRLFYESIGNAKADGRTRFFFVLGEPVSHSLSPSMMNAGFRKLKINAVYGKMQVSRLQLENFFSSLRSAKAGGANITIPHKAAALELCDWKDEAAKEIGAANVVVNRNGKLSGYNTDWIGALEALREKAGLLEGSRAGRAERGGGAKEAQGGKAGLRGKRALILGAGGSCKAIAYGLKKEGAEICIINRTVEHAAEIADRLGCSYCRLDERNLKRELGKADVVINTTSVGLGTKETPVKRFPSSRKKKLLVMDIVYVPLKTEMLRRAEKAGHEVVTGEKMLLHQGAAAFKLFTGKEAPVPNMRAALLAKLQKA